jgi:hypothetical protein
MIDLKTVINDEQLLDICLSLVALEEYESQYFSGPAGAVITARAINNILKEQDDFTDDEVGHEVSMMITGKVLENLTKKGKIEVDLSGEEPLFGVTKEVSDYFKKKDYE